MEDDHNGRRPQWNMTTMEDDQNGLQPKWTTTKMEDNKMEDVQNGRQPKWKTINSVGVSVTFGLSGGLANIP